MKRPALRISSRLAGRNGSGSQVKLCAIRAVTNRGVAHHALFGTARRSGTWCTP